MEMKVFDNLNDIVLDDMITTITKESKVSIAAACFSMYAYKELKEQLESIDECRQKKQRNKKGSFIYRGLVEKIAYMVQNLN